MNMQFQNALNSNVKFLGNEIIKWFKKYYLFFKPFNYFTC